MYILSMRSPVSLAIWIWATGYITKGEEVTLDPYVFAKIGIALSSQGFVGLKGDEIFNSIFIKLESPRQKIFTNRYIILLAHVTKETYQLWKIDTE